MTVTTTTMTMKQTLKTFNRVAVVRKYSGSFCVALFSVLNVMLVCARNDMKNRQKTKNQNVHTGCNENNNKKYEIKEKCESRTKRRDSDQTRGRADETMRNEKQKEIVKI